MTGHAETLGQALDAVILKAVESKLEESLPEPCKMGWLPGGPSGGLRRPGLHFSWMR